MALEGRATAQFDNLVSSGELLWADAHPRYVSSEPFNFQFRIAESLKKKPWTSHQKKVDNAFSDDSPDFSLGKIGSKHKLILNKYSVVRPQFVLHTIDFESQDESLSLADLRALWSVLLDLGSNYMAIFNCGAAAGASVGHKHMQIIPRPHPEDHQLFPDAAILDKDISENFEAADVPFWHSIQKLPDHVDAEALVEIYQGLRELWSTSQKFPHNVVLTQRWMMIVPRTKAKVGELSANAAAMLGIVWVNSEEQTRIQCQFCNNLE